MRSQRCLPLTAVIVAMALGMNACGRGGGSTHAPKQHTATTGGVDTRTTPDSEAGTARHGEIQVGGATRTYRVFAPHSARGQLSPLVLVLHGAGGGMDAMSAISRFDEIASTHGYVVAYPQGQSSLWNAGLCCPRVGGVDDVAFLARLLDRLEGDYSIDTKRVFLVGGSLGAMMSYRFACENAQRVSAVVSVAGAMVLDSCRPSRPVSVLEIHGTEDPIVPYRGGHLPLKGTAPVPASHEVVARWAELNGCVTKPTSSTASVITTETWSSCGGGSKVRLMSVAGATHDYYAPSLPPPNNVLDATTVAADFLSALPPRP